MLFRQIIPVSSENHTKSIDINAESRIVKADGTNNYHLALNATAILLLLQLLTFFCALFMCHVDGVSVSELRPTNTIVSPSDDVSTMEPW
jgi:hypothetical protein